MTSQKEQGGEKSELPELFFTVINVHLHLKYFSIHINCGKEIQSKLSSFCLFCVLRYNNTPNVENCRVSSLDMYGTHFPASFETSCLERNKYL